MATQEIPTVTPTPREFRENGFRPRIRPVRFKDVTADHLQGLLSKESKNYPLSHDYLNIELPELSNTSDRASEGWRRKLCEWTFEVVDHFNFDREVVSVALYYLDRVASLKIEATGKPIPKREFQLIAVTSLYIAIKLHGETDDLEGPRKKLKISAFQELSRGFFKVETLEATERSMLQMLEWRLNPPTSAQFVAYFLRMLPEWTPYECKHTHEAVASRIFDMAKYLTELSVCVSAIVFRFKSSIIGYAAILSAIDSVSDSLPLPYDVRVEFLKNISEATGLVPALVDVVQARSMLRDVCPALFNQQEEPQDPAEPVADRVNAMDGDSSSQQASQGTGMEDSGKISPVSVFENEDDDEASQRKRIRTCNHDSSFKKHSYTK